MTPSLFEPPDFDRAGMAGALARLVKENVFVGASSWKYEGWLGQIYTSTNYLHRGKFSKKFFEAECLREYAGTFATVCGDFAFCQLIDSDGQSQVRLRQTLKDIDSSLANRDSKWCRPTSA
ncbi:MAG: hypothetical protein ABIZ80_17030, partial [Bryobacteraceae bacterium]